jgi:hypothetical protein
MDAEKGIQLKIDILCTVHFIVSAWQQVTHCTIQNCFVKCSHVKKNQEGSDMTDVVRMTSRKMKTVFSWGQALLAWTLLPIVSVDKELATCGVLGSGSCMEEGQGDGDDDEAEPDLSQ